MIHNHNGSLSYLYNLHAGMTLLFEEKGLTQEKYADDSHPLYLYLQGNVHSQQLDLWR